jgi:OHCU decarboxylase
MSDRIAQRLNGLTEEQARATLLKCCASARWADQMLAARPFVDDAAVLGAAERIWHGLARDDWLEAFAAHPRIGDRGGEDPRHVATREWSQREQAGAATADAATRGALAAGNSDYERRFGHVFLICATGRTADEMLAELRRRLEHEPGEEVLVAAAEQARITRLRLERLADS